MMRTLTRTAAAAAWLLLVTAIPLRAATPTEFYVNLLRRGVADVEVGEYQRAMTPLRIAAFGLVDSLEHYLTAQVYLTIAADRLGSETATREAARRALAAERIERRYATLQLPPSTRQAFEVAAKKVLGPSETAAMFNTLTVSAATSQTSSAPTAPAKADAQRTVLEKTNGSSEPVAPPAASTAQPRAQSPGPASEPAAPAPDPSLPSVVPVGASAIESLLDEATDALEAGRLADARRSLRTVLENANLPRTTLIRTGEGLYRARDFKGVLLAFRRASPLRSGEEPYRYYMAIAFYETGAFDSARLELAAAIPFIEVTPDVARYREKIEAAR